MAIAGTFGEFDLAGVLQMLQQQRSSGRLRMTSGDRYGELKLMGGLVVGAKVGALGLKGVVCRYLEAKGCDTSGWVGSASRRGLQELVREARRRGALQEDEVPGLLRLALLDLGTQFFAWERASFRFDPEPESSSMVSVGIDELTLEAMRRQDEMEGYAQEFAAESVFERCVDLARFPLKDGELLLHHPARHVLQLLDGLATIGELEERTWLSPFRLREALHLLKARDWIEEIDVGSVHEDELVIERSWPGAVRTLVPLVSGALAALLAVQAMGHRPWLRLMGRSDVRTGIRLEIRERPARLMARVLRGEAPANVHAPESY